MCRRSCLRPSFRNYTLTLCLFYLLVVFFFHSNLDPSHGHHGDARAGVAKQRDDGNPGGNSGGAVGGLLNKLKPPVLVEEKPPANRPEVQLAPDSPEAILNKKYHDMYVNNPGPGANQAPGSKPDIAPRGVKEVPSVARQPEKIANWSSGDGNACYGAPLSEAQEFLEVTPNLFVYSAFWDTRLNDFDNQDGGVFIRIITVIQTSSAKSKVPLYCHFVNNSSSHQPGYTAVEASYYEMCENHGKKYGGYILSCKVPRDVYDPSTKRPPCRIRLSGSQNADAHGARDFAVVDTRKVSGSNPDSNAQRQFAICVAPLYGDISHRKLIEFLELSAILGASHVTFYDYNITPETVSLLNYFESVGRATLIRWPLQPELDANVWYHGQLISILDCLYRNMASTEYLAFNDIDEYIVPYNYTTWSDLMTGIDTSERCAYQFNSVFVDPTTQGKYSGPSDHVGLDTITNSVRSVVSSHIRTKCLVKPQLVYEAGIHHVSKPILAHLQTIRLDLPVAVLHHHRVCQPNFGMNCRDRVDDPIIARRFANTLYENVVETGRKFRTLTGGSHR